MGRYKPMEDGADMRADKESGTCPSGTDEPPGKATFNATLRCKIVAGQAAHKLADALPADIRESGHGQQSVAPLAALAPQLPAHRAGLSPTAPRGHNRPGASCLRDRQCPESAYINIIPSGLCNKSPRAALVSASHTIRIMLSAPRQRVASALPSNSRARRRQDLFCNLIVLSNRTGNE